MSEDEIFALAELHLGPTFNRGKIKAFADAIYGRGVSKGAEMVRIAYKTARQPTRAFEYDKDDNEL